MLFTKTVMVEAEKDPKYWYYLFNRVFGSLDGKKVLLFLLHRSGMVDAPTTFDPNEAQYLAYKKIAVLEILREMELDPLDLILDNESAESNLAERMGETNG
jgi:hypothetical protein